MHRRALLAFAIFSPAAALAQMRPIGRLSAFADGRLLLDGKPVELAQLDEAFASLKQRQGIVWYYRQGAGGEPHPNAMAAVQLVVKHRLPVSMSTEADFSDYVDESGQSKPRK